MSNDPSNVIEIMKREIVMRDKIIEVLKSGPKTVPEIAKAIGCSNYETMFWVMDMRKYQFIEETNEVTEEGYYKYKLIEKGD